MDDDHGPKNGDTVEIGPKPSTDATACQTSTQPSVPAWMLARNNSVHAPIFGQPSARKSTSCKPPSMPSSAFKSRSAQSPWAEIRAAIRAQNVNSEPKALPPSPQSSASVDLDTLNDDQALALLLKNETVAQLLQNAFNTRVDEHQQKLERAYNQRLLELEEYTRSWRDTTKELWVATSQGTFKPNSDQRDTLTWKGPQEAGLGFNPELPMAPGEVVEKEVDSDRRVTCIDVKKPDASHSGSRFNRQEWINSNGCGSKSFKKYGHKIQSVVTFDHGTRLLLRHKNDAGKIEYRPMNAPESTTVSNISKEDVIVELTPSNIALLGKAFCYLKVTRDGIRSKWSADSGMDISAAELAFLYDRFSQEPTKRHIDVFPLFIGKKKINSDLFAVNMDVSVVHKRLLIARPTYSNNGGVNGVKFFDVGCDTHTTHQQNGEEIILFEDQASFTRLALLLCFCIRGGIVSVSMGARSPAPGLGRISFKDGNASTSLQDDQGPHHSSAGSKLFLLMRSPYLPGQEFSKFLETVPKCGRIIFRLWDSSSLQNPTFFSWKGNQYMTSPSLRCDDTVAEFSNPNLILFWKAFCILKERNDYLLSRFAGPLSEVSRKAFDDFHKKLAKHYGGSLLAKQQITLIQSVSLPANGSANGGVYDSQAEGEQLNQRLVIARPYHQGNQVIGAEFFDTGSSARTDRVLTDIVLAEDTATLADIGHLLERAISMGIFPATKQDHPTTTSTSIEFPSPKSRELPQMSQGGEGEQSRKVFSVARSPLDTCKTLHDSGLELQKRSAVSESVASLQPSLFQRTLALSDGLKELKDESRHDQPDPQPKNQWLVMGGEPEDVRSPSPSLEQDDTADNRLQAHDLEAEVLPFGPTSQHIHEDSLDGSENSDLIMLDKQPKNVTFRCREKRPLPAVDQGARLAKKPKLSTAKHSAGSDEQLPQDTSHGQAPESSSNHSFGPFTCTEGLDKKHLDKPKAALIHSQNDTEHENSHTPYESKHQVLPSTALRAQSLPSDEQHPAEPFNPLPPPSEMTARRHNLRERLRQLGCRFEDNADQVDESTIGDEQHPAEPFNPLPPPSEMTARQIHKLREQLRRLGCRFEDNVDQVDESTFRGEDKSFEQLRIDIERFEDVLEAQREIENKQKVSKNFSSGAHLPSIDVDDQTTILSGYSNSLFTMSEGAADTQQILTELTESEPVEGMKLCKPSEIASHQVPKPSRQDPGENYVADSSSLEASAAPKQYAPSIPTEPKAFRGVPTEPRAMRTAMPQQHESSRQYLGNPFAISSHPNSQHQTSQAKFPPQTAPANIPLMPNQVDAATGLVHGDSTGLHIDADHQQPLRAVVSLPPPSRGGYTVEPANSNVFATVGRPVATIGPWDQETQSVSAALNLADELSFVMDDPTAGVNAYIQQVPEFPWSKYSNADEGEVE